MKLANYIITKAKKQVPTCSIETRIGRSTKFSILLAEAAQTTVTKLSK